MAHVRQVAGFPLFRTKIGIMPNFSGSEHSDQESPTGVINNSNKTFSLLHLPIRYSDQVYKDGMLMARDLDYQIDYSTGIINFSDDQIPQIKTIIRVTYDYMRTGD